MDSIPKKRGRPKGSKNRPVAPGEASKRIGPRHSPVERTLKYLRDRGAMAEKVERFLKIPGRPFFRRDLFRFIDVLAVRPEWRGCLGVQVCREDDTKAHTVKLRSADIWPKVQRWLAAGNQIELHIWDKRVPVKHLYTPENRNKRWTLTVRVIAGSEEETG